MYQNLVPRDQIRLAYGAVRHARTHHNQKVRLVHRPVCIRFSVISDHAVIQRMLCRHHADAHHRRNDRYPVLLRKAAQLFFRLAQEHTASGADDRLFRPFQLTDDLFDLYGMSLDRRLVGAERNLLGVSEPADRRILNVNRNVDQHRAFSPAVGNVERLLENAGNVIDILDEIAVLDEGFHRTRDVGLLEYVAAQQFTVYLTGDADQRDAVRKSRGDAGNHICRTGAGGDCTDTGLSGHPCHSARGMRRILLCPYQNRLNFRVQNTVEKRTDRHAGIPEHRGNPLRLKALYDRICSYHSSFPLVSHPISLFASLTASAASRE